MSKSSRRTPIENRKKSQYTQTPVKPTEKKKQKPTLPQAPKTVKISNETIDNCNEGKNSNPEPISKPVLKTESKTDSKKVVKPIYQVLGEAEAMLVRARLEVANLPQNRKIRK